jgi:tetratricopeptide (TPR) repeat protein
LEDTKSKIILTDKIKASKQYKHGNDKGISMIGGLLQKLGLTPGQVALLSKIFKISLGLCVALVLCTWFIRTAAIKAKAKRAAEGSSAVSEMYGYFEKKSRDLLPVDVEAHGFIAEYYLTSDQPQKAIDHILRILPVQRTNRGLMLKLATAYMQSGDFRSALETFTKLEEGDTGDDLSASVAARKGLTLFYMGNAGASRACLDKCVKDFPRSAEALCYLGEVEAAASEASGKAEEYFKKSLSVDSAFVESWYQYARFCMGRGDYAQGRNFLLKILEIEPLSAKTHARLGMSYYYLDQPEMAKKSYQTALALNPGDYNTHYNLGELFFTKYEDNASALEEFKKALAGNPRHAEANFRVGVICLGNGMIKEAIGYLESARDASPKNIRVLLQLGVAYEKMEMKDEALGIYRRVVDIDPMNRAAAQKIKLLEVNE